MMIVHGNNVKTISIHTKPYKLLPGVNKKNVFSSPPYLFHMPPDENGERPQSNTIYDFDFSEFFKCS